MLGHEAEAVSTNTQIEEGGGRVEAACDEKGLSAQEGGTQVACASRLAGNT